MGWSRRYAIVSYLRSSLWTVPLFALVVEQIGVRFLTFIDHSLQWVPALEGRLAPSASSANRFPARRSGRGSPSVSPSCAKATC